MECPAMSSLGGSLPPILSPLPNKVKRTHSVSLVIPAKNEALNIGWVLEHVPDCVDEIIVVDGLSRDGTLEVAKRIKGSVITVHEMRPGKGAAVCAGFDAALGEYVVMIDADGSMDPNEIGRFIDALDEGADLVKGSRFMPGGATTDMTLIRRLGNSALLALTNVLYGSRFSELCYGYMALRRNAISCLELDADGFEIEMQIVARALTGRLRISEVPSIESPRLNGASNLNAMRDGLRILRVLLSERMPHRPRHAQANVALDVGGDTRNQGNLASR